MDQRTAAVVKGWLALTEEQRTEFDTTIREYRGAPDYSTRHRIQESIERKADVGPYATAKCACCGK